MRENNSNIGEDQRIRDQESALRIMSALSGVDEKLLERSEVSMRRNIISWERNKILDRRKEIALERNRTSDRRKTIVWKRGRICAAVVCVAFIGVATWRGYQMMEGANGTGSAALNNSGGSTMQISSTVVSSMEEDGGHSSEMTVYTQGNNTLDMKESMSVPAEIDEEGVQEGMFPSARLDGEGIQEGTSLSTVPERLHCFANEDDVQDSVTEGCGGILLNPLEKLTEEEARNLEVLGSYIPENIPNGYVFESAYWNDEAQELTILWCKGMDDIHFSIRQAEECETVDINVPETYDVRLYEIPYGETVPQEYREVFNHPVFAWEDFSMEILQSRMRTVEDRGDTNTPRGNFGLLFPGNYLVEFQGRATISQVWEMFESLGL